MTSAFSKKITKLYNALMNRVNDSISSHNTSASAHTFGSNGASKNVVTDSSGNLITENKQVIVDNLTTDNGAQALSAKQGKILNERINFIVDSEASSNLLHTSDIADNLTTNDATKVLSAKQGKAINDILGDIDDFIESNHETIYTSEIIDSVVDNNMQPVTSNAVHDLFSNLRSNLIVLGLIKLATSLTINVPLNLTYSDAFSVTGVLKLQKTDVGIANQNVDLIIGDYIIDTVTTGNDGSFTFTNPVVSAGTHTFVVRYSGNGDIYNNCISSTLTRTVGKETSVNTLTTTNVQSLSSSSFSIDGTLLTDDAEPISNTSVIVKDSNDNTLTTLTTNSNGAYSGNIQIQTAGTYTLHTEYVGDSNYTASNSGNITAIITELKPDFIFIEYQDYYDGINANNIYELEQSYSFWFLSSYPTLSIYDEQRINEICHIEIENSRAYIGNNLIPANNWSLLVNAIDEFDSNTGYIIEVNAYDKNTGNWISYLGNSYDYYEYGTAKISESYNSNYVYGIKIRYYGPW